MVDGTYPENQGPDFSVDRAATDLELAYVRKTAESVTGRHDDLEYGDDPFFGADEMLMVIARLDAAEAECERLRQKSENRNTLYMEQRARAIEAEAEVARLRDQLATIVDLADDLVEARYLGARERLQSALAALAAPPDQPTSDEFLTCPDCGWATDEGADMARHECGPNA